MQPETVRAVEGIGELRDLAAHGRAEDLDQARALEHLALTDAISYVLDQQRPPRRSTMWWATGAHWWLAAACSPPRVTAQRGGVS